MKKFIYSIFAVLALSCTFVACGSDDDENPNFSATAEQGSAGTYSGTWTRTGDDGTETFSGTITLAAAGSGITSVTFSCPDAEIYATSVANVWHANNGYGFVNQIVSSANELGVAFTGRIDEKGAIAASFTFSQKVNRKNVEFMYEFIGNK